MISISQTNHLLKLWQSDPKATMPQEEPRSQLAQTPSWHYSCLSSKLNTTRSKALAAKSRPPKWAHKPTNLSEQEVTKKTNIMMRTTPAKLRKRSTTKKWWASWTESFHEHCSQFRRMVHRTSSRATMSCGTMAIRRQISFTSWPPNMTSLTLTMQPRRHLRSWSSQKDTNRLWRMTSSTTVLTTTLSSSKRRPR